VLQKLAASPKAEVSAAAEEALRDLAAEKDSASARWARETISALESVWRDRALQELTRLGAQVSAYRYQPALGRLETVYDIGIDESWQGGDQGLIHLRRLNRVRQLTLEGRQVRDRWLDEVKRIGNVTALKLRKTQVTDTGIKQLEELSGVQVVEILYSPVTDRSLASLSKLRTAVLFKLYGTKITRPAAEKLAATHGVAKVDWRRGAFLGVGGDPFQQGCLITRILPGSAAEKSGLQVGDRVTECNGKAVTSFESLTSIMADRAPGDTIEIVVQRFGEPVRKKITLGEWE